MMSNSFYYADIEVSNVLVNPNNARFYDKETNSTNEVEGMSDIINLNHDHVLNLCKDISEFGLMPTETLIVMPLNNFDTKMMAYDGNRRLTSLKLITQYKNKLNMFPNLTISEREKINKYSSQITKVRCLISEDLSYVNNLLYRTHSPEAGIGKLNWKPQSKSKHLKNSYGTIDRELAFATLLENFDSLDKDILESIHSGKWLAKMKRFTSNDEYMLLLGIEFNTKNDIIFFFDKHELKRITTNFFKEICNRPASEIAQTKYSQKKFLKEFLIKYNINKSALLNRVCMFSSYYPEFFSESRLVPKKEYEQLFNQYMNFDTQQYTSLNTNKNTNKSLNTFTPSSGDETVPMSTVKDFVNTKVDQDNKGNVSTQNAKKLKISSKPTERQTLIPADAEIAISHDRIKSLYEELKIIKINTFVNITAIAFRCLVEFSINYFIEKNSIKINDSNVTSFCKLEKIISNLERKYGQKELKKNIPAIYTSMATYKANKANDNNSIGLLNIIIHSYNYYPEAKQMIAFYDNYAPFLKLLWDNIE